MRAVPGQSLIYLNLASLPYYGEELMSKRYSHYPNTMTALGTTRGMSFAFLDHALRGT